METETEKEKMDIKNEMEEEGAQKKGEYSGITSSNDDSKTSADGGGAVVVKTSTIMVNTTSPTSSTILVNMTSPMTRA